jgi:hypothetical protein
MNPRDLIKLSKTKIFEKTDRSPRFAGQWVEVRVRIEGVVFLHNLQIVPHLFPLLGGEGRKVGAFLGPVFCRPFGKFLRLLVVFCGIGVRFPGRIDHGSSAERKVRDLVDFAKKK